ncbi:UDP-N-acetylglucosamine:LPS N-acetylglucosamine transferase [Cytobacillus purgationiresistens]|uniref:UDP-N-acetylglucosamine:LPS N-acetylglucosamine transferase n=1 Tax=Cytobacillus purgationiresistens TaxID=863449 RepID=A0ABU0AC85_9BACI|nr:UDP-N-acetylglucosamine:LPS N-acetylglucosamine transferase [Cytobacillus purgationiresistens]
MKIFTSFEEAAAFFPSEKVKAIGSPIRKEIFTGTASRGLSFLGIHDQKPIITIMGGSLGAKAINETVRSSLESLTKRFQIVHLCGKGQLDSELNKVDGYKQFEYIHNELPDILAASSFIITRGGSNSIFEFLSLQIPMLIIPLSKKQSRGDQILNAQAFERNGFAIVLDEENLSVETLEIALKELELKSAQIIQTMKQSPLTNGLDYLLKEIREIESKAQ